jgi:hypothetical protein
MREPTRAVRAATVGRVVFRQAQSVVWGAWARALFWIMAVALWPLVVLKPRASWARGVAASAPAHGSLGRGPGCGAAAKDGDAPEPWSARTGPGRTLASSVNTASTNRSADHPLARSFTCSLNR